MKEKRIWKQRKTRSLLAEESGMMVVEAVLSFTVFLMVVTAIVFLINIFTIHNKVQFAINSAAHEISAYSYLYQALGIRSAEQMIEADGRKDAGAIKNTVADVVESLNQIQNLGRETGELTGDLQELALSAESLNKIGEQVEQITSDAEKTAESVEKTVKDVKELLGDEDSLMVGMIYIGLSGVSYGVKDILADMVVELMTKKYLESGDKTADAYLESYGIKGGYQGLDFSGSTMFCDENMSMIDIVVEYDIDLGFIKFVMPRDTLHVVQRVSVSAWLDGDGNGIESSSETEPE